MVNDVDLENVDPDLNFLPIINTKILNYSNFTLKNSLSDRLTLFHMNIRSLSKNWNELLSCLHLAAHRFTIIALTETWLTANNLEMYPMSGYQSLSAARPEKRGGGVSIYIRSDLHLKHRADLDVMSADVECIFSEVTLPSGAVFLIGVVYRPPNSNADAFLAWFGNVLMQIESEKKVCYLLGDYNIDLSPSAPNHLSNAFLDTAYSRSFIPLIDSFTRTTSSSQSIIDNILTNNLPAKHESAVLMTDISDHYPLLLFSDITIQYTSKPKIKTRNYSNANKLRFQQALQHQQWDTVLSESSAQDAYSIFMSLFSTHYNNSFPTTEKPFNKGKNNPWLTQHLKKSIKKKNQLYVIFKNRPSLCNEIAYKRSKNTVRYEIIAAKKSYYHNVIESNRNHMKNLWGILKDLIGMQSHSAIASEFVVEGSLTSDKTLIANGFNEYFVNVGPSLASKIRPDNTDPSLYLHGNFSSSMFLEPVSEVEVSNCLAKLKNSSAAGHDDIKPDIIKNVIDSISCPLTHIINCIFQSSLIPEEFKYAIVTPIHKAGDDSLFQNYRPISVLPVFSKVFERLLHSRLYSFFQTHSIICDEQFGFRKGFSTDMALLTTVDHITASLDSGLNVVGLFLDLKKAFDTVDYDVLLRKLSFYGIRGNALLLCQNYLNGRLQSVSFDGVRSSVLPVTCGVPQGSILGPLFFLVYINDMKHALTTARPILYADDTNIFLSGKDLTTLTSDFNMQLSQLNKWFTTNRLSLNVSKTHAMLFTLNKDLSPDSLKLCIDQSDIDTVADTKFLGIYIDRKLTWNTHISHACNKVSKSIGILYKVSKYLNSNTLLMLYNCFILPYLSYGNLVWGNAAASHITRLFLLQKRAIRLVSRAEYLAHTNPLFYENRALKLHDLHIYHSALFVFKIYHNLFPTSFSNLFPLTPRVHPHSTRAITSNTVHIPYCRTSLRQKTFAFNAPKLFNHLITSTQHNENLNSHSYNAFKLCTCNKLLENYAEQI